MPIRSRCPGYSAWLLAGLAALSSALQASPEEPSAWRLGVAAGYGERSNPLIQSRPVPVVLDIDIAWFGRRFFFDNGDLGLTFTSGAAGTASVVTRLNSDRMFFSRTNTRFVSISATGASLPAPVSLTPPRRRFAVESGVEYLLDGRWGRLALAGFQDVSGVHGGFALDFEYAHPVQGRRWTFEPLVMVRYKSHRLNDYYWGVRASEASPALPSYRAGDGINLQGGLRGSFYLTPQLRIVGSLNAEQLNAAAARSPLVEHRTVLGWFGGMAWTFK